MVLAVLWWAGGGNELQTGIGTGNGYEVEAEGSGSMVVGHSSEKRFLNPP
jgi:hypothetical protein